MAQYDDKPYQPRRGPKNPPQPAEDPEAQATDAVINHLAVLAAEAEAEAMSAYKEEHEQEVEEGEGDGQHGHGEHGGNGEAVPMDTEAAVSASATAAAAVAAAQLDLHRAMVSTIVPPPSSSELTLSIRGDIYDYVFYVSPDKVETVLSFLLGRELQRAMVSTIVPFPLSKQLTLSFQGGLYVFDNVSRDEFEAVFLLLGCAPPPSSNHVTLSFLCKRYGFEVSPDKVEAAILLFGGRELYGAMPPPSSNQFTLSFQGSVYVFDYVSTDQMELVHRLLQGMELMIPKIELTMSFPGKAYVFDSVSPEKVQDVLCLLEEMELMISTTVLPASGNQLIQHFQCEVYVFDSVSPDKVQLVLWWLGERVLNPCIGVGSSSSPTPHI